MNEITVEQVKEWFNDSDNEDEIAVELSDLPWQNVGYVLDLPHVNDYQISVVFLNTARDYDSYGYSSLENGYVILAVTGIDGSSKNFKIPYSYASFEGWSWDVDKITEATHRQRIVTTWEWENL